MALFYWYSNKQAAADAGQVQQDRDGQDYTDLGYGVCMEVRSQQFFKFNAVSTENFPPAKIAGDAQQVLAVDYPHEVDVSVSRNGELSRMAQNICHARNFPATLESVQRLVDDFTCGARKRPSAACKEPVRKDARTRNP